MNTEDLLRLHKPCWACSSYKQCDTGTEKECLTKNRMHFVLIPLSHDRDPADLERRYTHLLNDHSAYQNTIHMITEVIEKCVTDKDIDTFEYDTMSPDLRLLAFGINRLIGQSMEDVLTGLPNRRYLMSRLENEWRRTRRRGSSISLLILDIDKFKPYNDTFGHKQGDVALACVGRVLANAVGRPGDFAARYGGEEFCVILGDTDYRGALTVAERIRKAIEDMEIEAASSEACHITCSIGVSCKLAGDSSVDVLFAEADKALYRAKEEGRNRVIAFSHMP